MVVSREKRISECRGRVGNIVSQGYNRLSKFAVLTAMVAASVMSYPPSNSVMAKDLHSGGGVNKSRSAEVSDDDAFSGIDPIGAYRIDVGAPFHGLDYNKEVDSYDATEREHIKRYQREKIFAVLETTETVQGINVDVLDDANRVEPFFIQMAGLLISKDGVLFSMLPQEIQNDILNKKDVYIIMNIDHFTVLRASYLEYPPLFRVNPDGAIIVSGQGSEWGILKASVEVPDNLPPGTSTSSDPEIQSKKGIYSAFSLDDLQGQFVICTESGCFMIAGKFGKVSWNHANQHLEVDFNAQKLQLTENEKKILEKYYAEFVQKKH